MTHQTSSQQFADHSTQGGRECPEGAPPRKPFEAPQIRREERLTRMTADQRFFGAES
jgi:hypothetical protein